MDMNHHLALESALLSNHSPDMHQVLSEDPLTSLQSSPRDFTLFAHSFDASADDMFAPTVPSTPQTVSPHELTLDPSPPSAALTHLSTPGMAYEHSPFTPNDSKLPTPASGNGFMMDEGLDTQGMYSLFPESDNSSEMYPPALSNESFDSPMSRTTSQEENVTGMHAAVNGVKSRSRSKPLPAIQASPMDDAATAKRKRNTLAARKSREKKQSVLSHLESERDDLKALVAQWKYQAEINARQVRELQERLRQLGDA